MPIGVVVEIPGGTSQQYDQVMRRLALGSRLPAGALAHIAGPVDGGWRIIDIWDDKEDFLLFVQGHLMTAMHEAGLTALLPKFFHVHNAILPPAHVQRRRAA